ncbi:MAG: hypothetical protein GY845_04515 [Planctomycetes bacterium]|nr:hypothetical protein [Planctomycetota bacterium]
MSPKSQIHISSYCLAIMITICSAFVILTFYVPKFLVVWAEMGIELNLMQRLVVQSVNLAQRGGLPIGALLFIGFVSALVWRIYCSMKCKQIKN